MTDMIQEVKVPPSPSEAYKTSPLLPSTPHGNAIQINPSSLVANWTAVKDHNLRTGIPNLEQLLSGKGRPPLDTHTFTQYVENEDPVGGLLLSFYRHATQFESRCVQYEKRYPIDDPENLPPLGTSRNLLMDPDKMGFAEVQEVSELLEEVRDLINNYLDPRSNRYVGIPNEFLWRARESLQPPGQPWNQILSPAKQHAFNALNNHFYDGFVHYCFRNNLCPPSAQLCLLGGAILLVLGFTLPLTMIFAGYGSRFARLAMIPLTLPGLILLLASYTRFMPILGLFKSREPAFRKWEPIIDPLIIKSHQRRAYIHLGASLGIAILLTILFGIIPPNHLMRDV